MSESDSIGQRLVYDELWWESGPESSQWLRYQENLWLVPSDGKSIHSYLPVELLREIFLYCLEAHQMKSVQLVLVCRHWRSVIITISHLWSTLRVGSWTEREQVSTWLQRAYPLKVVIDTERARDCQGSSNTPCFAALQDALTSTGQWNELTISSFPPDNLAGQLSFRTAGPMNVLKVLHVAAGCVHSPSFTHLLDLVPTEALLSELRLYPSFASTHFLQPHWFPVLANLRVLIVNGRGIHEPFGLLPAFTQLQVFEADHLPLSWYEPNANLPLLCTLQRLHLRASSVQWMAGREFPCVEECAILLPHSWVAIQQHGVQLPSCKKLAYHGYPITTVQYLHVPQVKAMELKPIDCKEQRVNRQLYHLWRLDTSISKLTTLHLTLQCSEQVFSKVLKYFGLLEELVLSIAHPSPSWQSFLESLAAKPSTEDWPEWGKCGEWNEWNGWDEWDEWDEWCSSQTWHANVLPHLKYLGIKCPTGFSKSECIGNFPLLRHAAWTRGSPLEHLDVWEGNGTTEGIPVDYLSPGYLERRLGISNDHFDSMIVRGMVTQHLCIGYYALPSFCQLPLTGLFRQLQGLIIQNISDVEIWILPDLEQIKRLSIWCGIIPAYSLNIALPLAHTLQWLDMHDSTCSWMLGRCFKALEECHLHSLKEQPEGISGHKELQVDLPACRTLEYEYTNDAPCSFLACPNVQFVQRTIFKEDFGFRGASTESLHNFLLNSPCLQELRIGIPDHHELNSLILFIFCDSLEQGAWEDIRSVNMKVYCPLEQTREQFFNQMVGRQQHYGKGWKEFLVSRDGYHNVNLRALM